MSAQATSLGIGSEGLIQLIFEHAARISREQDYDSLIRLNADFARNLAGADRCSLWLIDEKREQLWTRLADGVDAIRLPAGEGLVGACILQSRTFLVNDVSHDDRHLRRVDIVTGYRTEQVLCVPLHAEGRVIGALQLLNKLGGFTQVDVDLLQLLAYFSASAIQGEQLRQQREEARLLQHELDLAREVQARLLPVREQYQHIDFVGFCRPAESVGGDYYDAVMLRDGSFAFTLGDVAGKGVPAALAMASIQVLLRSLLQRQWADLAGLISELSQAVYASSTRDRYSTLFCGVLSNDRKTLTYVNAGHIPPLLLRQGSDLLHLCGRNVPVGILPAWTYTANKITVQPGDLVVVVSDGVVEACDPEGEFWEDGRLEIFLSDRLSSLSPIDQLPSLLCNEVDSWARGCQQHDDITIVALQIR